MHWLFIAGMGILQAGNGEGLDNVLLIILLCNQGIMGTGWVWHEFGKSEYSTAESIILI